MTRMNDASDKLAGPLFAAGLFLATALASQWLQHQMKNQDHHFNIAVYDDDEISEIEESSTERYHRLKLQRQRIRRQREHQQQQQAKQYTKQQLQQSKGKIMANKSVEEEEDCGYEDDVDPTASDFREYYRFRRLTDRLSFENLRPLAQPEEFPSNEVQFSPVPPKMNSEKATNADPKSKKSPARKHKPFQRKRAESAIDREDEYDYLPKRSNWSHFEHYNEDDIRNGIVNPSQPKGTNHHFQAFSHGYKRDYASDEAAQNMPLEGEQATSNETEGSINADAGNESDTSEEPQFVWMDASVREPKSRRSLMSTTALDPSSIGKKEPHLPKAVPLEAQSSTINKELPPAAGGPPSRVETVDSQETAQVDNQQQPANTSPPANSKPTNGKEQRQFLRHASSIGTLESSDDKTLPQRFIPNNIINKVREKLTSQSTTTSSGHSLSRSSSSEQSKRQYKSDDLLNSGRLSARAQYNAKIMPNKVVMVRHGQSMGNINEELYSTTPDNAMPLTKLGWDQARKAGQHLKNNVLNPLESVHFIVSPYARTVETFHGIVSAWCDPESPEFTSIPNREMRLKAWYGRLLEMGLTWHEDPRIREQDFGNYQDPELIRQAKQDRHRFGTFYYRFPHGESASDVYDRVSTFLDSLWRSFDMNRSRNYVLVTHGISIRVLLARYFRYTIHQFNILSNPRNCEMVILSHDGYGRLRLQGRCQLQLKEEKVKNEDGKEETVKVVDEYKFHKRLAILPQAAIRKVPIRICYNDTAAREGQQCTLRRGASVLVDGSQKTK